MPSYKRGQLRGEGSRHRREGTVQPVRGRRALRHSGGFTLIEMMVTVAIIGAVAALAIMGFGRQKPRAQLNGATTELQALLHEARQNALATGRLTVVMVFPAFRATADYGAGRFVVYEDGSGTFFTAGAPVNFGAFVPTSDAAGTRSRVVTDMNLARQVWVGPSDGQGAAAVMPAPFDRVPIGAACTFCVGDRGAIAFDSQGGASFYSGNGAPLAVAGGSVSLYNPSEATDPALDTAAIVPEIRTLTVVAATGSVRVRKKP